MRALWALFSRPRGSARFVFFGQRWRPDRPGGIGDRGALNHNPFGGKRAVELDRFGRAGALAMTGGAIARWGHPSTPAHKARQRGSPAPGEALQRPPNAKRPFDGVGKRGAGRRPCRTRAPQRTGQRSRSGAAVAPRRASVARDRASAGHRRTPARKARQRRPERGAEAV
jgi:hypothetical protein